MAETRETVHVYYGQFQTAGVFKLRLKLLRSSARPHSTNFF